MGLLDELSVLSGNPFSLLSSSSASESRILGNELAFVRKWNGVGDRKLLESGLWGISVLFRTLPRDRGCGEWLNDRLDCGEAAGDIIRRKLTGFEGVRH